MALAMLTAVACSTQPGSQDASDLATVDPTQAATVQSAPQTPSSPPSPSPVPPSPTPQPEPVVRKAFDGRAALATATDLAAMGTRDAGTPGDLAAQDFVRRAFEEAGWDVTVAVVPLPQGGQTANLVATLGEVRVDEPHVVVGGHLDTQGGSPGANDNASGIGVLVELARELADEVESIPVPIVLVAFGAEEYQPTTPREHHLGSQVYAEAHGDAVVAALIIDMVGNGPETCICWFGAGPRTLADRLASVAAEQQLDGHRVEARGDISDHGPFARRGIPAAFLWSGNDGRLHTPQDTAEHLRVEDIQRAGDLALAFLRDLDATDRDGLRAQRDG